MLEAATVQPHGSRPVFGAVENNVVPTVNGV